jgi:hypothetical protein
VRPSTKVRSELAVEVRCRPDADYAIGKLRQEYKASRAGEYLRKVVDDAPPLTPGQIAELQAILSTAGEPDLDASGLLNAGEA